MLLDISMNPVHTLLLFQVTWQYVFVCCYWKVYMAFEFKQNVLFINFYILVLLCLKWTSPFQGKHIFLGGMNHCWLNHLPLRAEARSSGSSCDSCDVWVSCSGFIPLWLFSSWLIPLSNGDVTFLCILHRGTVRSDEFLQGRDGNGMMGKSEKMSVLI